MYKFRNPFRHRSDTPKEWIKKANKKALRKQSRFLLAGKDDNQIQFKNDTVIVEVEVEEVVKAPFAVLIWDDGLDYNMDGTSYQDDAPGSIPHSYHFDRKAAEAEVAWLEHRGCDPSNIQIVTGLVVPPWHRKLMPW